VTRFTLPSGEWAEIADRFKGSLAGKVTGAVMIEAADGKTFIPGDIGIRQTDAFLKETITDWSLAERGIPIPKTPGPNGMDRTSVIGDELDAEDYAALHEQVQPLVLRIVGTGRGNAQSSTPELSSS
jgi:hypothetical protein